MFEVVVIFTFPAEAVAVTKRVPSKPLILGAVPESESKTKSVVSAVKDEGIVTSPDQALLLSNKVTPIAAIFNHALIKTQNDYFLILYIN